MNPRNGSQIGLRTVIEMWTLIALWLAAVAWGGAVVGALTVSAMGVILLLAGHRVASDQRLTLGGALFISGLFIWVAITPFLR
ncbi:MAG: hypothetical protein J5I93_30975 [Pirellulaceae bacterium]|nr:hypothetical protein [Pirellulaceae bacterium]